MDIDTEVTQMISAEAPIVPLDVDIKQMDVVPTGRLFNQISKNGELDMTGAPIGEMANLGQWPELKSLTWRNLSNDDLLAFLIYYKNANLESLDISRGLCNEGDLLSSNKLPKVFVTEHLKSLNVSRSIRCDQHALKVIVGHEHLVSLDLACTALLSIKPLVKLGALTTLNVSTNYLRDGDAKFIVEHFKSLRTLNISRNELSNDGIITHFDRLLFRFRELDISNQKFHYVTPETLEQIQRRVKEVVEAKEEEKTQSTSLLIRNIQDGARISAILQSSLRDYPNIQTLTVQTPISTISTDDINWRPLSEFKQLEHLELVHSLSLGSRTAPETMKSSTCWDVTIRNSSFFAYGARSREYAKRIRDNKRLNYLALIQCSMSLEFVLTILESPTIQRLSFGNCSVIPSDPEEEREMNQALLSRILSNEILEVFNWQSMTGAFGAKIGFSSDENNLIWGRLWDNRKRFEVTKQVVPLLAATQLGGGSLRHSSINVMPMIYKFLDVPLPSVSADEVKERLVLRTLSTEQKRQIKPAELEQITKQIGDAELTEEMVEQAKKEKQIEELIDLSKKIEAPTIVGRRRTRSGAPKPLPLMFQQ